MTFKELLADFSKRIGSGITLEPDDTGTVNLTVDDLSVSLVGLEEAGLVVVSGIVGEIPPADHQERLYKALLMANNNFAGTNGATFSLDPESGAVKLCTMTPLANLDSEKFFAESEKFVNTLETWHKIVEDFRGGEVEAAGEDAVRQPADEPSDSSVPGFGGMGGFMQV